MMSGREPENLGTNQNTARDHCANSSLGEQDGKLAMASRFTSSSRKSTVSAEEVKDAIIANNCQVIQTWLSNHTLDVNEPLDDYSWTPLHVAAAHGHEGVVVKLLEHEADVNAATKDGRTPLHWAAQCGHEGVVVNLLEHEADVNAADKSGWTPLHWAAGGGHEGVVVNLLEHEADVNAADKSGQTPLHVAAGCGHEGVVVNLLEHEADVNAADKGWGRTPLHKAAEYGHEGVVEKLIEHEADVNAANKRGWTPLYVAAEYGREGVVIKLIEHEADVNAADRGGRTALDMCSGGDRGEKIKAVLEKHMDQKRQQQPTQQQQPQQPSQAGSSSQRLISEVPPAELFQAGVDAHFSAAGVRPPSDWKKVNISLELRQDNKPPELLEVRPEEPPQATGSSSSLGPQRDFKKDAMYHDFAQSCIEASSSVALISWSNDLRGTGFRVGQKYMMTNYHVVEEVHDVSDAVEQDRQRERIATFHLNSPKSPHVEVDFTLNPVVAFDKELDIAIVEIRGIVDGPDMDINIPPPLKEFRILQWSKEIQFVGHPAGDPKRITWHCPVRDTSTQEFKSLCEEVKLWSFSRYNRDTYHGINNPCRILYDVSKEFTGGSSGSPGFVIGRRRQEACVAVVHTYGYPYLQPGEDNSNIPQKYFIEQGVRIEFVYDFLYGKSKNDALDVNERERYGNLCKDIFPRGRPR